MNLDRKELIAGHPTKKVRDFLKNHFEYEIDVSSAQQISAEHFGSDSEAVLAELIKRRLVGKAADLDLRQLGQRPFMQLTTEPI